MSISRLFLRILIGLTEKVAGVLSRIAGRFSTEQRAWLLSEINNHLLRPYLGVDTRRDGEGCDGTGRGQDVTPGRDPMAQELETYRHCTNVHDLPDIHHYWTGRYNSKPFESLFGVPPGIPSFFAEAYGDTENYSRGVSLELPV